MLTLRRRKRPLDRIDRAWEAHPVGRSSFAVAAFALIGLGCGDHGGAKPDAAADGIAIDATSALTLDIGVTGCGSYDAATATCAACAGLPPRRQLSGRSGQIIQQPPCGSNSAGMR